jgi:hypothetical protein
MRMEPRSGCGHSTQPTSSREKQSVTELVLDTHGGTASGAPESRLDRVTDIAWCAMRAGDARKAEELFRCAVARSPDDCAALWGLVTLLRSSDPGKCLAFLDRLIELQPGLATLYTTRGVLRQQTRDEVGAVEDFATVVGLEPDNADALYNLGLCYSELFCPAQAEDVASLLLQKRPDWPAAKYLLVKARVGLEREPGAVDAQFAALIKQDPLNIELRFARGLLRLKMGDFAHGWDAQEWRWGIEPVKSSAHDFRRPRWSGEPLHGRRLLVVAEQGFGDILQFARFLPPAVESGADWVGLRLEQSRSGLRRLLGRIKGIEIVGEDVDPSRYDVYCPLASLPYALDTTAHTIPPAKFAELEVLDIDAWRRRLAHLPRPWVGLCWAGSPEHFHDIRRSMPLVAGSRLHAARQTRERRIQAASARVAAALGRDSLSAAAHADAKPASATMESLLRRTAGTLVSLQIGPRSADLDELPADLRQRIVTPLAQDADYYDTACLVSALDDVLTVDTSVAHVAGVVAARGLVVKPAAPEWRWTESDGRPLWYPQLRLTDQLSLSNA